MVVSNVANSKKSISKILRLLHVVCKQWEMSILPFNTQIKRSLHRYLINYFILLPVFKLLYVMYVEMSKYQGVCFTYYILTLKYNFSLRACDGRKL